MQSFHRSDGHEAVGEQQVPVCLHPSPEQEIYVTTNPPTTATQNDSGTPRKDGYLRRQLGANLHIVKLRVLLDFTWK
jgi:hypothetical protein